LAASGTPVGEYFLTKSVAPRIIASSIAPGALLNPDVFRITLTFSKPMLESNIAGGDYSLHGNLLNVNYTATGEIFNADNTVIIFTYDHLPDDDYTLTLLSG